LIAETLRAAGHQVWIDDELLAHRSFTDSIEQELNAADAVIVVWSNHAVRSEWVRSEASRARQAGKLVQVRLERCQLPMPYDQIHCVDLSSWSGDQDIPAWRSVLASVAAVTGVAPAGLRASPGASSQGSGGAGRRSERRQVTALFCDLVNSGSLAARLDPEDMMHVFDIYQAARDDIITQHDGAITETTGHRLLAYFGYPRADEEEAAKAVRAALALCEAVGRLDLPAGVELQMRVGVATGLVVIADVARGGGAGGVVGETPHLAALLESIAPPNAAVVSEATRRITEGLFTYRDLGAQALPGYQDPVKAFEAVESTAVASRSQARPRSKKDILFGRETELALMLQRWALAREGEGQVVLVQGEGGIGKTRLVDSFSRHLGDAADARNTWYCAPQYSYSTLHPIVSQLARAAGFDRADDVDTRRVKLGGLLDQYGATAPASHAVLANLLGIPVEADDPVSALIPSKRKALELDTLLAMMDRRAGSQPALFVIEDLHWADPTTLELLERAIQQAAERRWMILATARPEFEANWSEHADITHIQLGRLTRADAARICAELGADALLPAETVGEIVARSDGVPLFVEEMTKSVLEAVANAPKTAGVARVAIPNTLQDSLAARLDRLGSAKLVASLGAAIGRRFSYELLAAVASQPAAELRQALRELVRAGLVERSGVPPDSHYLFKHALIRDAAYESLLKREREALHGRIAGALGERFPETAASEPALVAYHLTESGAIAAAVPLWAEAGRRAAAQAAHAEAASYLRTALDLVRRTPADAGRAGLELQLLADLGASLSASQGYSVPEVARVLAEARAICDSLGDVNGLFVVLLRSGALAIVDGDVVAAEEAARRCAEISEQTGLVEHRIEADEVLAGVAMMKGDLAAAKLHCERGVKAYRENDGPGRTFWNVPGPLTVCLAYLPLALHAMGDSAGAERAASEMVTHLSSLAPNFDLAFGSIFQSLYNIVIDNSPRALRFAEQALLICEENGYDTFAAGAVPLKAVALGRQGNLEASIEMAARAHETLARLRVRFMHTLSIAQFANLQAAAGDTAAALSTIDQAIAHSREFTDRYYLSPALRHRAEILAQMPDADPAEVAAALREAVAVAEAQGAEAFASRARSLLKDVAA